MEEKITALWPLTASFAGRAFQDVFSKQPQAAAPEQHLRQAVAWLKRAQDQTSDGGVSQGYYFMRGRRWGWLDSYRETSGYIAETLFDVGAALGDPDAEQRALTIADWLTEVQNPDGSFSNPSFGEQGIVFDTGQVLLGLVRAYQHGARPELLDAATRAGQWLTERVDQDGAFRRNTHNRCVHTYNTRVAWAMLKLNQVAPDAALLDAARRNLDWALTQERGGWFQQNAFTPKGTPFTHNIAYAIRGVLESSIILDEPRYRDAALRAAEAVLPHLRADGFIPSQIDETGRARARSCCLTGNCQLSIIWFKLYNLTGDSRLRQAAESSLEYVMRRQDITTKNENVRGAIAGSFPVFGRYSTLAYPNWAAKFFIDAMLLSRSVAT